MLTHFQLDFICRQGAAINMDPTDVHHRYDWQVLGIKEFAQVRQLVVCVKRREFSNPELWVNTELSS